MILVTGGAGFIGSHFVLDCLSDHTPEPVIVLDKLTYSGCLENLSSVQQNPFFSFVQGDVGDQDLVRFLLKTYQPKSLIHFAAETHVDRSIKQPRVFVETNILGCFNLLEEARRYYKTLTDEKQKTFRFLQISTDEVYGCLEDSLGASLGALESSAYRPNSPYSASKASADFLVRSYYQTYGLPVLVTHSSNNYGPHQYPEKLIPLMIERALSLQPLPIYGDGLQIRDWIYVTDHVKALRLVLSQGQVGHHYNIGAYGGQTNLFIVDQICNILDEIHPRKDGGRSYGDLKSFVTDRLGHDRLYALDSSKIRRETGWFPKETFESGLRKTIQWFLQHNRS
jgi:dTDP-glucose 4,6-dehydratase